LTGNYQVWHDNCKAFLSLCQSSVATPKVQKIGLLLVQWSTEHGRWWSCERRYTNGWNFWL